MKVEKNEKVLMKIEMKKSTKKKIMFFGWVYSITYIIYLTKNIG